MGDPLSQRHSLAGLAARSQVFEITKEIRDFGRLSDAVAADLDALSEGSTPADWQSRPVVGRLEFGLVEADKDVPILEGELETTLQLVCQRCLEPVAWPLATTLRLQLAAGDEPQPELDGYELWELEDNSLCPLDLVDEALVMAMPIAARHETDACSEAKAPNAETERMTTPFATLREQMEANRND